MGRSPCCAKVGLKKGAWTPEEDQKLLTYIERHGHGSWGALPAKAGLQRCGKSCRLRWTNYLRPDIKRGKFTLQEEQTIIQLHALLGNRWSAIATHLTKRTDNEIKNHWNTHLKKRLTKMGIDPTTHKPKTNALGSGQEKDTANLSHMAQWESARIEAESRIVRESNLISTTPYNYHPHLDPSASSKVQLNKATIPLPRLEPMAWQGIWTAKTTDFSPSNGSLQSPTSALNFADNIFTTNCKTSGFGENFQFPGIKYEGGITKGNDPNNWKFVAKPNDEVGAKMESSIDTTMQLNDIEYPIDAAYLADSLMPPSFMKGLADADSCHNIGSSCGGDLEDNRKYWNNILIVETDADSCHNLGSSCGGDLEDNRKYWNNILN